MYSLQQSGPIEELLARDVPGNITRWRTASMKGRKTAAAATPEHRILYL
jgi:hypothetical protein